MQERPETQFVELDPTLKVMKDKQAIIYTNETLPFSS